jgi:hypothetical protein
MTPEPVGNATASVVKVGAGRGFVLDTEPRVVVTAAHCLPELPPPHPNAYTSERTYAGLLGRLVDSETPVSAECLFVDPVGDIAVLGQPDNQALYNEAEAYDALIYSVPGLRVSDPPEQSTDWLLGLDGDWFRCTVKRLPKGPLFIFKADATIQGGMSGSPILAGDGTAIGVVCASNGSGKEAAMLPCLTRNLPGWLLRLT